MFDVYITDNILEQVTCDRFNKDINLKIFDGDNLVEELNWQIKHVLNTSYNYKSYKMISTCDLNKIDTIIEKYYGVKDNLITGARIHRETIDKRPS